MSGFLPCAIVIYMFLMFCSTWELAHPNRAVIYEDGRILTSQATQEELDEMDDLVNMLADDYVPGLDNEDE